jgi:hypothetical protein
MFISSSLSLPFRFFNRNSECVSLFSLLTLQWRSQCTAQTVIYVMLPVSVHCTVLNAFKGTINVKGTQCTYNATLWRFGVTTVALETQKCLLCVLLRYMSLFLVNKTNRCNAFQSYWYYYSTCFGQPFCPSSGVLSRTWALVHFVQLWPFATRSTMARKCHPTSGSKRSSQLHKMYQSRSTAKNSWWWAERVPETCRVVIPIKLEFNTFFGFIHKEFKSSPLLFKSRKCSGRLTHFPWMWYVLPVIAIHVKLLLMLTWN